MARRGIDLQPTSRPCARHLIVPFSHPARLISAPWVLPIASPALAEAAVVVDGEKTIVALGPRAEIKSAFASLPEERAQGALLPGLVNSHTHLELSVLAGHLPGGKGLPSWATQVGRETAFFSAEQRFDAARRAAMAAAAAGTAAVGDVGNTLLAVPALAGAGLAGVFFHELLGSREAATGDALADAGREYREFVQSNPWPANLARMPAPHALYSAGPDLLRRIFAAAAGEVWTPPLDSGCLPGITREVILEEVCVPGIRIVEKVLYPADLEAAEEVFITSTTRDLLPVRQIEDRQVGRGDQARMALQAAFLAFLDGYVAQHRQTQAAGR